MELKTKIADQFIPVEPAVNQSAPIQPVCEDVVFNGPSVEVILNAHRVRNTEHLTALHCFWRPDHPGHLQTWTGVRSSKERR